ncbi:sn-glycerol-3-phosphate import ATP-binding protein UgpC [Polymorphum gilvum]|uniref:Disease resistance protein:ATP/GTP-binding site motif A (P-loop):ABC transporter:AAA ATPase n=1 Tax=Polymorphum gilvum (strain LMG 25793 / CGMCC 1.9160 / SL003B-26A1) TaxID=991905 RepID=F2J6W2_POLGS|nr:sn-glycerol-3-phosphate import ATP-binding protein UgpC [Polymorphum gilvum]ADZ72595.1 Disease resistance protein:ATP/GTP-binding site motif A (P-loop):ABC transporter:AAA ATPase [Polymorphum gilvum SL003B-26A1]
MATITLDQVRKVYAGNVEAVKGVSLDIADGEFIVLVGPSGCGKSTLLRMIAGLEAISAGDVRIGDRVVNRIDPAERDIAMVFQNYALYPHMTVYNNLAYGLKNRGVKRDEIDRRVKKAADILEIGAFLDRKPRALSGGQRQRVAMGRAIVREPAAFLFDEPLSNLDAKLRVQMRVEIKRLQKALGTTSVYVTHDQLEAMTLADRLVVINGGIIEQVGAPIDVYDRPASTFVAGFIGSPAMNLVPVHAADGRLRVEAGDGLDAAAPAGVDRAVLGVRPEHLHIVPDRPVETDGVVLDLEVAAVEPVGAESFVHGRLGAGGPELVVRAPSAARYEHGARILLHAPASALHLFDRATGRRLDA